MVLEPVVRPVVNPVSRAIQSSMNGVFSPAILFTTGQQGVWYDPSDASTLFSDTAGTTPCATPGTGNIVPVGLMLDKSQGLALGSELVTNGDFSQGTTGWTTGTGWAISGGSANGSAVAGADLISSYTTSAGKWYRFQFTISGYSAGIVRPNLGQIETYNLSANGTYSYTLYAASSSVVKFFGFASFTGSIDNVSVRELPGNHATSYNTTTARPELSARVNLLTYSEQFDNGLWVKNSGSVSANSTVAPDGTTTADTFTSTAAAAAHNLQFNGLSAYSQPNVNHTAVVSVKAGTHNFVTLSFSSGSADAWAAVTVDLSTGTATKTGNGLNGTLVGTPTVVSQGNEWYRISLTARYASGVGTYCWISTNSSNTPTYGSYGLETWTPAGTETVFVWGADLRPANIGTSVPAYQRIADQYTYDSSGFPRYLKFDGIDDGMYTPANLNLSGTDKATVFAGVRKLSDAAAGVVTELSATAFTNNGAFAMSAPGGALNSFFFRSRGTSVSDSEATFAAPTSRVVTGIGDIGADTNILRVNGTQAATSSADQGTGNYGSYALNIGVRSAAATPSLYFNGYIYSLIVVGAASTAAQISSTESWINVKEGTVFSPPAPGFAVLPSSGSPTYTVTRTVLDSAGTSYSVPATVLDSAGTSYTPI